MSLLNPLRALPTRPAAGRWWVCVLTALLLAFQVTYVRIHLLTDNHYGIAAAANPGWPVHVHHHDAFHDSSHDHDSHQPHSAGDHELQLVAKRQISFFAIDVLLPETTVFAQSPEAQVIYLVCESGSFPGESPPDPRQPRAPPTV